MTLMLVASCCAPADPPCIDVEGGNSWPKPNPVQCCTANVCMTC